MNTDAVASTASNVHCLVCLHETTATYTDPAWVGHSDYTLRRCESCESIFTWPLPDEAALSRFYADTFDYPWYRLVYQEKLVDARTRVAEISPFLGKNALDYGGGQGYFAEAARENKIPSTTYDPFMSPDTPAPILGAWDSVVALHVLEHSRAPEKSLAEIRAFLKPDGHLIMAVPNAAGAGYQKHGMGWTWAQPPLVHIFHFTAGGLTSLLTRCGFSVVQTSFHDRWDANNLADVDQSLVLWLLGRLMGTRPFKYFSCYRMFIARCQGSYRRHLLRRSALPENQRAELLIIARNSKHMETPIYPTP